MISTMGVLTVGGGRTARPTDTGSVQALRGRASTRGRGSTDLRYRGSTRGRVETRIRASGSKGNVMGWAAKLRAGGPTGASGPRASRDATG